MIFLYFFITVIIILGIYFAVEFGVKYFVDKKRNKAFDVLIQPTLKLPQVDYSDLKLKTQENIILSKELNMANVAQESLNKEELVARLENILMLVVVQKQYQQLATSLAHFQERKRKLNSIRQRQLRKRIARNFESQILFISNDLNLGLSVIDEQIKWFEGFINNYSDSLFRMCDKRKELTGTRLRYSIVVKPKFTKPKKL